MTKYPTGIDDNFSLPPLVPGSSLTIFPQLLIPGGVNVNLKTITTNDMVELTDYVIVVGNTSGPIGITLPPSPSLGDIYIFKDGAGLANTNNITIFGNGNNIDGSSTYVIAINYTAITLIFGPSGWMIF